MISDFQAGKIADSLESLALSMKVANLTKICKELHDNGKVTDEQYKEELLELFKMEGGQ